MIHLYFGDGKGKTSAAVGLCVRALSRKLPVVFAQFLKSKESGEIKSLQNLGAKIIRKKTIQKFTSQMTNEELLQTSKDCLCVFEKSLEIAQKTFFENEKLGGILVFDEIFAAINLKMLEIDFVLSQIEHVKNAEIVLTGRNPPLIFFEKASYITQFNKIKHPFDAGVFARGGIEF